MKERFNDVLRRLPQSTDAWSCPWFESIFVCLIAAVALGVSSAHMLGLVPASIASVLGVVLIASRRSGAGPSC